MRFIVVDVGNSRMKWGLASAQAVVDACTLPLDDAAAWREQRRAWHAEDGGLAPWVVAGSNPGAVARFAEWLRGEGAAARGIDGFREIPLEIAVDHPETVGLDRLFNALAASREYPDRRAAIVVDAGSAVTVDLVERGGVFRGGAIFPGLRLMARALHDHVPQLPVVALTRPDPPMPGHRTVAALEAGIHGAVVGGIQYLLARLRASVDDPVCVLTGGDAAILAPALGDGLVRSPWLTLEGMRLAALHAK